jgi:hypothetical protein
MGLFSKVPGRNGLYYFLPTYGTTKMGTTLSGARLHVFIGGSLRARRHFRAGTL